MSCNVHVHSRGLHGPLFSDQLDPLPFRTNKSVYLCPARLQPTLNTISLQAIVPEEVRKCLKLKLSGELEYHLHTCKYWNIYLEKAMLFNMDLSKLLMQDAWCIPSLVSHYPHLIHLTLAQPTPHAKRHLDRLSRFAKIHPRDQQTDRQTHRP